MPTNVPPQYRKAEERFREAVTVQEKIVALQEMLTIMPKHKIPISFAGFVKIALPYALIQIGLATVYVVIFLR